MLSMIMTVSACDNGNSSSEIQKSFNVEYNSKYNCYGLVYNKDSIPLNQTMYVPSYYDFDLGHSDDINYLSFAHSGNIKTIYFSESSNLSSPRKYVSLDAFVATEGTEVIAFEAYELWNKAIEGESMMIAEFLPSLIMNKCTTVTKFYLHRPYVKSISYNGDPASARTLVVQNIRDNFLCYDYYDYYVNDSNTPIYTFVKTKLVSWPMGLGNEITITDELITSIDTSIFYNSLYLNITLNVSENVEISCSFPDVIDFKTPNIIINRI